MDRCAREQVGHLLGEHVGALLVEERSAPAPSLGALVGFARLGFGADLRLDHLVATLETHREDRCLAR